MGQHISIHALREEGDDDSKLACTELTVFLSTPSARRATVDKVGLYSYILISIHALREEGDKRTTHSSRRGSLFLSTPSARRATHFGRSDDAPNRISIHALREEGDANIPVGTKYQRYFYPRPPRGGRQTS